MTAEHGKWTEPSAATVDRLTYFGVFAGDLAVLDAQNAGMTSADQFRAGLRAALRMLLANGLIEPLLPSETEECLIFFDPPPAELQL